MTASRTLNRPLIASITIHLIIGMICWFIVINPARQMQRLIEVSLIELPKITEQEPIPEPEPIRPKRVRRMRDEIKTIPIIPQIKQSYSNPATNRQIVEKPIRVETPLPLVLPLPVRVEPLTNNRLVTEERHDVALPVARSSELPKEEARERTPAAMITPQPPAPHFAKGHSVLVEGLGKRRIKYQPMFKLPSSVEEKGVNLSGALKFWVSPDGSIDRVEVVKTFGFSEVDRLACAAVYKWRLEELSEEEEASDWGIVRFKIQLN